MASKKVVIPAKAGIQELVSIWNDCPQPDRGMTSIVVIKTIYGTISFVLVSILRIISFRSKWRNQSIHHIKVLLRGWDDTSKTMPAQSKLLIPTLYEIDLQICTKWLSKVRYSDSLKMMYIWMEMHWVQTFCQHQHLI